MVKTKTDWMGSKSRDLFKWWHKQPPFPNGFYACDVDFVFVKKEPPSEDETEWSAYIVAILDYKYPGEPVTFSECIAYNDFVHKGLVVYIVEGLLEADWEVCDHCHHKRPRKGSVSLGPEGFTVWKYKSGDWRPRPPNVELEQVHTGLDVEGFIAWESELRANADAP